MKLVTFSLVAADTAPRLGAVTPAKNGLGIVDLSARLPGAPRDMIGLIAAWEVFSDSVAALVRKGDTDYALTDVSLLAPVPRPGKILGIGLNYADHIRETGHAPPADQLWFAKMQTCVTGPFSPVQRPRVSEQLDYEAELAVIIGRKCRHVLVGKASEVIFGYCAANDVSVRDWQRRTSQYTIGKSFDSHAPLGPWIVTADEVADPHALEIRCLVNGEQRQHSNTRELIFNCFDQIAFLSQAMTLEPGDVLLSGTPGGVGAAFKPPRWLRAGDVVKVEIEGIGAIENTVEDEP